VADVLLEEAVVGDRPAANSTDLSLIRGEERIKGEEGTPWPDMPASVFLPKLMALGDRGEVGSCSSVEVFGGGVLRFCSSMSILTSKWLFASSLSSFDPDLFPLFLEDFLDFVAVAPFTWVVGVDAVAVVVLS
jgi:hypothetical protein